MDEEATYHQNYVKSFAVFRERSIQLQKRYVQEIIVPHVIENIQTNTPDEKEIHILSVGCGYGDLDIFFLEGLLKGLQDPDQMKITYTDVDVNKIFVDQFTQEISKMGDTLSNIEFNFIIQDFHDFLNDEKNHTQRYNIINFWHVLYYLKVEHVLINSMIHILKPGGCITSIVASEEGFVNGIINTFSSKIEGSYHNYHKVTSVVLENLARKQNWIYKVLTAFVEYDLTNVIYPESEEGRLLLHFILHCSQPVSSINKEVLSEIVEHFRGLVYSHDDDDSGRKFASFNDDIIFLYKPIQLKEGSYV